MDPAPGGNGNGIAEAGEYLMLRARFANIGGGPAAEASFHLTLDALDPYVTLDVHAVTVSSWPASLEDVVEFQLTIDSESPTRDVAVVIDVSADSGGPWHFTDTVAVVVPAVRFARRSDWVFDPTPRANKDGAANPGERIEP
ncbi:hypothetical protein HN371_00100, partial [Candidatus Poribacteria bacterium]|nr:hypothetical protein [Candidatus Poribacteria bacterium]